MWQNLKFKITGTRPILLHCGQTADPLNRFSKMIKEVTKKRAKTDADHLELRRLEWYASIYTSDGRIIIPSGVLEAAIVAGARKTKDGKQAEAGLIVPDNQYFLEFPGDDLTIDELWERDQNRFTVGAGVSKSRVQRTRFIAYDWALSFELDFEPGLLNKKQLVDILTTTGEIIGIGDWRPKFGRFKSKLIEVGSIPQAA